MWLTMHSPIPDPKVAFALHKRAFYDALVFCYKQIRGISDMLLMEKYVLNPYEILILLFTIMYQKLRAEGVRK